MDALKIDSLRIGEMLDTTRLVTVYYVEALVRGAATPLTAQGDVTSFAVGNGGARPATFGHYSQAQAFLRLCAKRFGVRLDAREEQAA